MGAFRKQEERRQAFLLPASPSDWLPEGQLAWFVIDAVEQLNPDALLEGYRPRGASCFGQPDDLLLPRGTSDELQKLFVRVLQFAQKGAW